MLGCHPGIVDWRCNSVQVPETVLVDQGTVECRKSSITAIKTNEENEKRITTDGKSTGRIKRTNDERYERTNDMTIDLIEDRH